MPEPDLWQAGLALRPKFRPSAEQWDEYREIIIHIYLTQNRTMAELRQEMEESFGFVATRKMYIQRLHQWDIRKYLSEETKNELCARLLLDFKNGRDTSYVGSAELKQLIRHCRTKRRDMLSEDLNALYYLAHSAPQDSRRQQVKILPEHSQAEMDHDGEHFGVVVLDEQCHSITSEVDSCSESDSGLIGADHIYEAELDELRPRNQGTTEHIMESATTGVPLPMIYTKSQNPRAEPQILLPSLVNQFAKIGGNEGQIVYATLAYPLKDTGIAIERLLHHIRAYYTPRVRQHLQIDQARTSSLDMLRNQSSKAFWSSVKNAIYLINRGNSELPFPILKKVGTQIPDLCEAQPVSLLRELLTTLAVVNTQTCPGLRTLLLQPFSRSINQATEAHDLLREICMCLQENWIQDEILTIALCSMLRIAKEELLPGDEELFELNRAHIRLLRRRNWLNEASALATEIQPMLEHLFGEDSVQTRLVMSERLYISNTRLQWKDSLDIATDIIERARRHDGTSFPSQRSIYHCEDLAEVYERLGNPREAAHWLKSALDAAMNMWHDREGTLHIKDKLHRLQQE